MGLEALLRDLGDWTWYACLVLPPSFPVTASAKVSLRVRTPKGIGCTARLASRGSTADATRGTNAEVAAGAAVCSCETIAICAFAGVVEEIMEVLEEEAATAYG